MDIHNKTKEQLISELLNLQEQNSKLKSQLDSFADLKNAEELLLNSEIEIKNKFATLSSIFESTQNIIMFSLDTNYCYTAFTNLHKKTMKLIWGVDIAIGMNMLELIQLPADRKKAKDNFDKVLSGEHLRFEEEYGDVNFLRTYFEDTYNPIIDSNGIVVGLSVFIVDITERKQAEQALKYSKQQYEHLFEFSGASIIIQDIEGKYQMVNKTATQHFGLPASEIVGKSIFDFFPAELALNYYNQNKFLIETDEYKEYEDSFELNGKLKTFYIIDKCLKDENGKNDALISSSIDITERKLAEEELKSSREELRNFSTYLLKIRENERADITLEIHDSIAQFLVALKVEMGLYLKKMSSGIDVVITEEMKTKMEQLVSKVDITLKSARMIMNGLRPEQLELLGLVEATEVHLHNFEEIHHIKCNFENTVSEPITHQEQSIVLFRILEESLTNILKHANANSVTVKLTKLESNLMLEVIDNGVGFDEKCMLKPDSYGVISMREQVKRFNGIFKISSQLGKGTLVHVEIPYKELKISKT